MTKVKDVAELAALLAKEAEFIQCSPSLRPAYYSPPSVATIAADAMALARIGASVTRWAVAACNGIVRYQGNGISCGTWHDSDEAAKERADKRAFTKAQAIADRYGAKVELGGDPRGCVLRLHLESKRTNGFASEGWGV